MMIRKSCWAGLALVFLVGCGETTTVDTPPTAAVPGPGLGPDQAAAPALPAGPAATTAEGKLDLAAITLTPEEIAEIKKLPEADQELALAQKVCAVGEEEGHPNHLGTMGKPIKVSADGKTAFLCCAGCKADFEKDPAAAFAKIGK